MGGLKLYSKTQADEDGQEKNNSQMLYVASSLSLALRRHLQLVTIWEGRKGAFVCQIAGITLGMRVCVCMS